ncbi:PCC domain-containing protein [Microvirga roseola]|uniref:PCC domain-containing protein n=1 Tax=Microvirga roseola TaxID=2883126 RepID=UPI001E492D97|nr:DUF296 domain-containing protein [Microvirga roseola]
MRHILHPGPANQERTSDCAGSPVPLRFILEPGLTVDEAVARGFAAAGCRGGFVALDGLRCEPFSYVIPAASSDARHAAWYSHTFEPDGIVEIERACAIVGIRDERPFLHCHGIWNTADGPRMGHLLAPETVVAEPLELTGIGMRNVTFEARPDPETNFTLFEPVPLSGQDGGLMEAGALLAKVRPNEDISLAIEAICARHGIGSARIHGIGSLNGVRFEDGTRVDSHATEVLIRRGCVQSMAGHPRAQLDIDVVDIDGAIFSGELIRGDNPVCVTFELVIETVKP